MPDLSEVADVLVSKACTAVYPSGTSQPSVCNAAVKLFQGWPVPNDLESSLRAGNVQVSVYPLPTERKTNRNINRQWNVIDPGNPTITTTVSGSTVTFAGSVSTPQNVYILVNGKGYQYSVQANDTLTSIATSLTALIKVSIPAASNSGAVITIPSAYSIIARTGGVGLAVLELKRQEKEFQITIWAPTPIKRNQVAEAIDVALCEFTDVVFADQSHGILRYCRTFSSDQTEKSGLYRRDLVYSVDYATTKTAAAPQVIAPTLNLINKNNAQTIKTILE
jgi:hypothetical protein